MKKLVSLVIMLFIVLTISGCSVGDAIDDFRSDTLGINRICQFAKPNGEIVEVEGMIRLHPGDGNFGHFTVDGKRHSMAWVEFYCVEI